MKFRQLCDRPLSPEELSYCAIAKRGLRRQVIVFGRWYPSVAAAAKATKNSKQTISGWLRKGNPRAQYA